MHRGGYGLQGSFSLEELHARDLSAYYHALQVHPHHNDYQGRAAADLTPWVECFTRALAAAFEAAHRKAQEMGAKGGSVEPDLLRRLDPRARAILALFARAERITASQVAATLALSQRSARTLLGAWARDGWIQVADPSNRGRQYSLSAKYRRLIGIPKS